MREERRPRKNCGMVKDGWPKRGQRLDFFRKLMLNFGELLQAAKRREGPGPGQVPSNRVVEHSSSAVSRGGT